MNLPATAIEFLGLYKDKESLIKNSPRRFADDSLLLFHKKRNTDTEMIEKGCTGIKTCFGVSFRVEAKEVAFLLPELLYYSKKREEDIIASTLPK
ncbi:unnamed protein product [Rhizophagus irregularis]|nr:unnamed protein product [Rhizophagus irregularis]